MTTSSNCSPRCAPSAGPVRTHGLDDATRRTRWPRASRSCATPIDAAVAEFDARAGRVPGRCWTPTSRRRSTPCRPASSISTPRTRSTPYVAIAARGPWVVTLKGAVLHDTGGYGMLGFGHTPEARARGDGQAAGDGQRDDAQPVAAALRRARCARRSATRARRLPVRALPVPELRLRSRCRSPARIADVNAKLQTDPGAPPRRPHDQAPGGEGRLPRPHRAPGAVLRFQPQGLRAAPGQLPRRGLA